MFGIEKVLARHFEGLDKDGIEELLSRMVGGEVAITPIQPDEAAKYAANLGWFAPHNNCFLVSVVSKKFGNLRAVIVQGSSPEGGTAGS